MLRAAREVLSASFRQGSIHAGNFAYLAIVTMFPAAILLVAIASGLGDSKVGEQVMDRFLATLPAPTEALFHPLIDEVMEERAGKLITLSALVGLWTVSGFIETLRQLVYEAFGVENPRPFWLSRLLSGLITLVATLLAFAGLFAGLLLQLLVRLFVDLAAALGLGDLSLLSSALLTGLPVFLALWLLLAVLGPPGIPRWRHWPGALIVAIAWAVLSAIIGPLLSQFGEMARTYGTLTGVMVALLFFYLLGFALVIGVETNAALSRREGNSR